jgi:hypothetical protein
MGNDIYSCLQTGTGTLNLWAFNSLLWSKVCLRILRQKILYLYILDSEIRKLRMHRISSWPDIRPFLKSGTYPAGCLIWFAGYLAGYRIHKIAGYPAGYPANFFKKFAKCVMFGKGKFLDLIFLRCRLVINGY